MRPEGPAGRLPARATPGVALALAVGVVTSGCATSGREIGAAVEQPFRDLNLVQEEPASVVRRAAEAPYAPPVDCFAAAAERRRLDRALGPDLGPDPDAAASAEGLAASLVREVAGLPFRGVVRRISGAEKADRELRRATVAAVARRGFLRGWMIAGGCAAQAQSPGAGSLAAGMAGGVQERENANR